MNGAGSTSGFYAMKNVNSLRISALNDRPENPEGGYVLYWMQANRRLLYHFGLQYAVAWANKLGKPLLVYEAVRTDYPWASDRFHTFIMEGMAEHATDADRRGWAYFPFVEREKGEGRGLVASLAENACIVISDAFPTFIIPKQNAAAARKSPVKFVTVDSNGILPMALSQKGAYSAFIFRRTIVQRHFRECWEAAPDVDPLVALENRARPDLSNIMSRWPDARPLLQQIPQTVSQLPIDHTVHALPLKGTRQAALETLDVFVTNRLSKYAGKRNHPDETAYSGLSPYLHFGKISAHEVADRVLAAQPPGWTPDMITYADGQNRGFFKGDENIESFMDEFVTWREIGYHFCNCIPDHDTFEGLPDWVRATLEEHDRDPRAYVYSLEELERSKTHDVIWNAAQRQLVEEGVIHNYLRMLWGKKILEWSPDAREALRRMIHLNNKYAIDGRNPNSYSGIMWVMGRFDRPWAPARPVFGTVRYMSSDSTKKKIKLDGYLKKFGAPPAQTGLFP
jgi:deoxyribodipyrimidine photo-lyase